MSESKGVTVSLAGKVAFVTGSARGIGWAIAGQLAAAGAKVAINGRSDQAALEARATELRERHGAEVLVLFGDVADPEVAKGFYTRIFQTFKRLDVLVNNAGLLEDALIGMIDDALIDRLLRTNVAAVVRHVQAAARLIGRNPEGGSIVNLASIVGTRGNPGQMAYGATKAAVIGATLSAAKELAPKNVRVNAIAPGLIDTDMIRAIKPERIAELERSIGMGRKGTAEDVARVALFLASDLSSYVTGQVIGVDGGMVI
jgi:3-oxoacyl-[acyl-carrier protein] reductase